MRMELRYFRQAGRQIKIYQILILMLLLFFLLEYYYLLDGSLKWMPWEFIKLKDSSLMQMITNNTMAIIFYTAGILLPLKHFGDYMIEPRILVTIRQQKNRWRYLYFIIFSMGYIIIYFLFNIMILKLFGSPIDLNFSNLLVGGLNLLVLLMLTSIFELINQFTTGKIIAIIVIIFYAGTMNLINLGSIYQHALILLGIIAGIGILANYIYLNHEIY
jgi:hypothetical protein